MKNAFCKLAICLVVAFVINSATLGAVRLPSIIGNHMVLPQNSEARLWGWCNPGEKITIKTNWDTITYHSKGESTAKWSQKIKTPAAGGPYRIIINDVTIDDVMVGEVWLCSGQSNMERSVAPKLAIEEKENNQIRLFYVPKSTSVYPQENCQGVWKVSTPEEIQHFTAVGYFFGKNIQKNLNTPVGLINSNWGGTAAEAWTPDSFVNNNPRLEEMAKKLAPSASWPTKPGLIYNAMIYPLTKFDISGVIWYQGENNVWTCSSYQELLTTLIGSWRKAWGKEFPFYYVQIAPYSKYGKNMNCALLREAQTNCLTIPKTGMVVISDLVDDVNNVHPTDKVNVGLRLANLALSDYYGKSGLIYKYPVYKSMKIEKDRARIEFTNAENGLICRDAARHISVSGFYIAGEDRKFLPATAKIDGNSVIVYNKEIKKPVAVRFGFTNTAMPNLFSKEGMPVNLFRTDNWDVLTIND
jgi:sialate O-acetylesterase